MTEYVDSAVQTVLSSSRLKLAHPGNAKLTEVYPTPSETTSVLAQAVNNRGQFRVSPNSLNFGARSDFVLSSSALISEMAISGTVEQTFTAGPLLNSKPNAVGWAFDLIESIEITYSNSLMQNMFIRGETLKDYSLLCCTSARERQDMLKAAGQILPFSVAAGGGTNSFDFVVPISFLNHSVASLRNSWPVDGSVLAGPIQISINWRSALYAFVKTDVSFAAPTSFKRLELIAKTTQLQDASFSVKKAMMLDPELVYSLPARYITSVDYSATFASGTDHVINLASAPSGMLEGLILSIRPNATEDWVVPVAAGTNQVQGGSVTLNKIKLEFGGQNLIRCDTHEEWKHFTRSSFGDDLEWVGSYYTQGAAYAPTGTDGSCIKHSTYFLPLLNDGSAVFRGHTNENLPSYGGSQLQLTLNVAPNQRALAGVGLATPSGGNFPAYDGQDAVIAQGGTGYQIWVGYVVSALVEISQGTVDLQL